MSTARPIEATRQEAEDLRRAASWVDDPIDPETARWADQMAEAVARYAAARPHLRARADVISKELSRYLGLSRVVATVERFTVKPRRRGAWQVTH